MNQGIIKVSNECWKWKQPRKLLKRNFKIIAIQEDLYLGLKILKCESKYFLKPVKDGCKLPEYEVHFETKERKFLFFNWKKTKIIEVKLFEYKDLGGHKIKYH